MTADPADGLGGRLPLADPAALSPEQRALFDRMMSRIVPWADEAGFASTAADGRLIGPFNPALLNPAVTESMLDLSVAERTHTSLTDRVREVVILAVGAVWRADYEVYAHAALARTAGLSEQAARMIAAGEAPAELSEQETIAQRLTMQLPRTPPRRHPMKAFALTRYGKTNNVAAVERAQPDLRDDDVLVQIHAASVNPLDLKIRNGELKPLLPYKLPIVLGNDLAGVVVKTGPRVRGFKPGDAVYAKPRQDRIGAFAEYLAINESDVALKPERLDMTEAAALPLVALTAWQALVEKARVQPGQRVLIHAGSGGLGSVAIQLAKHLGATVATTTSAKNAGWVKDLGADVVIDYKTQDFADELSGYDVVLDTQGGKTLEKSLQVLKPGGTVISVVGPPDPVFAREFGANWMLIQAMRALSFAIRRKAKRRSVTYAFLFMTANGDQLRELGALVDAGVIRPVIDRVFPFDDTLEALSYVESGRSKGKVVVTVTDEGQRL